MRKSPLPLLLLAIVSCQSSLLDSGDSYFRQQSYLQAYNAYMSIGDADAEVQQRIATTRYFLLEDMVRDFSNRGEPDAGLALLKKITPLAPDSRQQVLEDLDLRCRNHIATRHFDLALQFNDIGDKNSAIRELLVALTWRDDFSPAIERLAIITEREQMRNAQGEEKYLDAIAQLEAGSDVRARTAFMHASHLLTDPKLASKRLNAISENLAEEAMRQAQLYLDAQQTGMAWVAVKNAIHLGIDDPAALAIAERLDDILRSQAHLISADIKVRAGDHELAKLTIDKAAEHSVVEHTALLIEIRNRNTDLQQEQRYLQARAYEIDSQLSHASSLYLQIYSDSDEYGYRDTEQRLASIATRLSEAELYYQQALLAAENGDAEGHMQMLRSVLQLSIDYKDALHLFDMANRVN